MSNELKAAVALAKQLRDAAPKNFVVPPVGSRPSNEHILPFSIVRNTRGYIERVAHQVNGCYEKGWFDGCAVMMRRLVETLIIECYEFYGIQAKIKDANGNYLGLDDLINKAVQETKWSLTQGAKTGLPKIKKLGDLSAHSRKFNARPNMIEDIRLDFCVIVEELLYISNMRK
jgi:hypothetical protein